MEVTENCIEWITGDKTATVTLSQKKYINRLRRICEKAPEDARILAENPDGSVVAHISLSCLILAKFGAKNNEVDGGVDNGSEEDE